jgi:galactokinase
LSKGKEPVRTFDVSSIREAPFQELLEKIYPGQEKGGLKRIEILEGNFSRQFGSRPFFLFSSPGRVEICGNHTDHNHGKIVAAAVNIDTLGMAVPHDDLKITLFSKGYDQVFTVHLASAEPRREEEGTTLALIRGIAGGFLDRDYKIGGFDAAIDSQIPTGSGLSSSASFSVLIGEIFNTLYNQKRISPKEIAQIAQYAENRYFGKPCGLMDQLACAYGGMVTIDFRDNLNPVIDSLNFNIQEQGYCMLIVDSGGSHADLTADYASIKDEMKEVAGFFPLRGIRYM